MTRKAFARRQPRSAEGVRAARGARHDARRRRTLQALAAGACLLIVRAVRATPEELAAALRSRFGDRPLTRGRVELTMPRLAENGNVVPVTISVDSPMSEEEHVRSLHLFASENHVPRILDVQLGPYNGKAVVSTRVRLARSQRVTAVAVMSDETLWYGVTEVEVVTSECGM